MAGHAGRAARPMRGLRAVPLLRRRQAGTGLLGRPAVQAARGAAGGDALDRRRLRHPVRRSRGGLLHAARDRVLARLVKAMPDAAGAETPALVTTLAGLLLDKGWMMATAESCTGGLIAGG